MFSVKPRLVIIFPCLCLLLFACGKSTKNDVHNLGYIDKEKCQQIKLYRKIKYVYSKEDITARSKSLLNEVIDNITPTPFKPDNYLPFRAIIVELQLANGETSSLCLGEKAWSLWDPKRSIYKEYKKGYPKFMQYKNEEKISSIIYELWCSEESFNKM